MKTSSSLHHYKCSGKQDVNIWHHFRQHSSSSLPWVTHFITKNLILHDLWIPFYPTNHVCFQHFYHSHLSRQPNFLLKRCSTSKYKKSFKSVPSGVSSVSALGKGSIPSHTRMLQISLVSKHREIGNLNIVHLHNVPQTLLLHIWAEKNFCLHGLTQNSVSFTPLTSI